jgi:peptide/nickel transport system substrate-binding protein
MPATKRNLAKAVSLLILVALLAACGATPTPVVVRETVIVAGTPQVVEVTKVVEETVEKVVTATPLPKRDVIIVALSSAPDTLDPADHRNRQSETVLRNMFDGLVTRDSTSGVHLELAETINWLDEKTLEVKLRQGVKFHDGVEMTADDVVFTFDRIIGENKIEYPEPHTSPRKGLIAPLESIEKTGDYTVVMHFSAAWPVAMQMLVHQQIVPKHYLEEVGTEGFVSHPIGTGPFKFVSAEGRGRHGAL